MTANMHAHDQYDVPDSSLSRFDLKAPARARREFDKGHQMVLRGDSQGAIPHLSKAIEIYPEFVAAHNLLGSVYLSLGQNDHARDEFAQAISIDDHLPNLHLNLGIAQLGLKDYSAAENSLQKASSIAPLDLALLRALAYGQFANKDYPGVIATAQEVHGRKHEGSGIVHYFAAGAFEAQNKLTEAQQELETLLREEPKFTGADQARQMLQELQTAQIRQAAAKQQPVVSPTFTFQPGTQPTSEAATLQAQKVIQDLKEKSEIEEAETADAQLSCASCNAVNTPAATEAKAEPGPALRLGRGKTSATVLRASVDEVAVFFAATDHGKSVTDLTGSDVGIRDNQAAPARIIGFRNESQLPLRLGLVIDVSDSVASRFRFEQDAAKNFLQKVVTGKDDLAFVIGVNNSVLLVQDYTGDQALMSHAIGQLAPTGGTALWDAVTFAADKLARRAETQPVARILVVISDGQSNSGANTLKEAIERAQHGEVAVYTVSTRDYDMDASSALLGDHALRTLSDLTGGAAFSPGSVRRLKASLADLHEVIRGRYLVTYKPALFERNGQYRSIDITAQKDGHKLHVYARKGYFAAANAGGTAQGASTSDR
jgi:VWFA-related protein